MLFSTVFFDRRHLQFWTTFLISQEGYYIMLDYLNNTSFVWVKSFAEKNYSKPAPIDDSVVIELDEMWHFLHSKKDKFGFGRPTAELQNISSIWNMAREMLKH